MADTVARSAERADVLALLDRELAIAEYHDLLVGTKRLRELRDIIARGEHRREVTRD
jgi:hypothetical protein